MIEFCTRSSISVPFSSKSKEAATFLSTRITCHQRVSHVYLQHMGSVRAVSLSEQHPPPPYPAVPLPPYRLRQSQARMPPHLFATSARTTRDDDPFTTSPAYLATETSTNNTRQDTCSEFQFDFEDTLPSNLAETLYRPAASPSGSPESQIFHAGGGSLYANPGFNPMFTPGYNSISPGFQRSQTTTESGLYSSPTRWNRKRSSSWFSGLGVGK